MKVCPKCKNKVSNLQDKCPVCGAEVNGNTDEPQINSLGKVKDIVKNDYKLTGWNIAFIVILNVIIVLIALNVFNVFDANGIWCDWPIVSLLSVYFLVLTCFSKRINQFVTRLRNTVWFANLAMIITMYIRLIVYKHLDAWILEYFITSTVICFDIIMTALFLARKLQMFNAFVSSMTMTPFAILVIVYSLCKIIAQSSAGKIMVLISCLMTLCVQINFACFYFFKYKEKAEKIFKLWE